MTIEDFFAGNPQPRLTRSVPGRLDVMGGMAAYSGSLVLQMPVRKSITVALALRNDTMIRIHTQPSDGNKPFEIVAFQLPKSGSLTGGDALVSVILACLLVWQERAGQLTGMDIWVHSQIPAGKGLASAAALTVAMMQTLADAHPLSLTGHELARLALRAEKLVASGSLAAQLTCVYGVPDRLLPILCQPDHASEPFALPEGVRFAGIDSGICSAEQETAYQRVCTAAMIGYTLMALHDGTYPHELELARQTGDREHLLYNGYLANITPLEFEDRYKWLPNQIKGSDFLEKYGIIIDPDLEIEPDNWYPVAAATRHPVYENVRIQYFSLLLQHLPPVSDPERREKSLRQLGSWMYQSHESYSACGLGHPQTDVLVQQVRNEAGNGVYGARITDKGSGGTVCILYEGEQGWETVQRIHAAYERLSSNS